MRFSSYVCVVALAAVAACSAPSGDDGSEEGSESAFTGTPDKDIGQVFMIEHFGVTPDGYPDVSAMIKSKNLGAVILWNPTQESGDTTRKMVAHYASVAAQAGTPELFVSADQEEAGTQRFKARNGFTDLVSGATLGRVVAAHGGDARVCELHARITSREMAAAGMNMTLGTVSDIFTRDSGTPGMFRTRAISSDPNVVAPCITAMTKGYAEEGHVVFVTKHFPGLGNASGNTDVDPKVHSFSDTKAESDGELLPYRTATKAVNDAGSQPLFGTMISHASYHILDPSDSPATLSPVILGNVLRDDIGLQGVTVSDAFWTWGATKNLSPIEKRRLMLRAFLAGIDILMIAHADFNGAWDYFQSANANQLPEAEQAALVHDSGLADWGTLHSRFRARLAASIARIKDAKTKVGPSASFAHPGAPNATSADLVREYATLTR